TCHPGVMPSQHTDGGQQNCRVEQLLPGAIEKSPYFASEVGNDAGPKCTACDACRNPPPALRHRPGGCQDDADNQSRLDDLTKDDYQAREHQHPEVRQVRNCIRGVHAIGQLLQAHRAPMACTQSVHTLTGYEQESDGCCGSTCPSDGSCRCRLAVAAKEV